MKPTRDSAYYMPARDPFCTLPLVAPADDRRERNDFGDAMHHAAIVESLHLTLFEHGQSVI